MTNKCNEHRNHEHKHELHCGHTAVEHNGHIDYIHDGHLHHPHDNHVDEHSLDVNETNPDHCTPHHVCSGHNSDHVHGPDCGHESVPHGDHIDYIVDGHLHHPHGDHCDNHGPISIV